MSYNTRSGHCYGNQKHKTSTFKGYSRRKQPYQNISRRPNKTNEFQTLKTTELTPALTPAITVKTPITFTQPAYTARIANVDIQRQTYEIIQLILFGKYKDVDLEVLDPQTLKLFKFKVVKIDPEVIQDFIENQQSEIPTIIPGQSIETFSYVQNLKSQLQSYGYSLTQSYK